MMALGPYLHVGGKIVTIGTWAIPMPYLLLYYTVPFIGLTRSLSRYDLMVMLSLGVLVAIGLVQLQIWLWLARKRSRSAASPFDFYLPYLISIAAVFLICFEFLATPYPVSKIDTPAFFYDIAADSEDYTIAELPMNWDRPTPLLHQTVHGKRLLTAYTSRNNPLELAWRTPVLQEWRYLGPDIIDQPLADIAPTIFYDFNLRYIVLDYWQMPPGPERAATEQWVAAALPGATPIYADDRLKVYQTPPMEAAQPYLTLGSGWSERQVSDSGQIRRTFGPGQAAQAELFLHHPPQSALTLEITAAAETDQSVSVYANDRLISTFTLTPEFTLHAISLPWPADDPVKLTLIPARPAEPISVSRLGLSSPD